MQLERVATKRQNLETDKDTNLYFAVFETSILTKTGEEKKQRSYFQFH